MRKFSIILLFLLGTANSFAGAWPQEKGRLFLKLSATYLDAEREFTFNGIRKPILADFEVYKDVHYLEKTASLYLEYGWLTNMTFWGQLNWKASTSRRTEVSNYFGERELQNTQTGLGDLWSGLQLNLFNGKYGVALRGGVKFPLGYVTASESEAPVLGNGEREGEVKIILGRSFFPYPLYFSGGTGYRWRSGSLAAELLGEAEMGLTIHKLFFKIYLEMVKSRGPIIDLYGRELKLPLPGGGGVLPEVLYGNQEYLKILPSISLPVAKQLSFQIELVEILSGKNIVDGSSYTMALIIAY
ncbi:MAG: hypothetical protein Kow0037_11430 [Calditrichia bacterium]